MTAEGAARRLTLAWQVREGRKGWAPSLHFQDHILSDLLGPTRFRQPCRMETRPFTSLPDPQQVLVLNTHCCSGGNLCNLTVSSTPFHGSAPLNPLLPKMPLHAHTRIGCLAVLRFSCRLTRYCGNSGSVILCPGWGAVHWRRLGGTPSL